MAGLDNPTGGSIVKKKSVRTGYLPQDPVLDEESTVLEAALNESSSDVARVARAYEEALLAVEAGAPGAEDRLAKAMSKMDAMNAWDLTSDAISMLEEAGLQGMLNAKVKELSGGQKRRVSIAASLLCKPQLLLMDGEKFDLNQCSYIPLLSLSFSFEVHITDYDYVRPKGSDNDIASTPRCLRTLPLSLQSRPTTWTPRPSTGCPNACRAPTTRPCCS